MAETLQRLLIKLEANTEQLQREMRKASGATDKFAKTTKKQLSFLEKSFKRMGRTAQTFVIAYAAALVTKGIKNTILLADNMGMLEDRIKSATRETGGFKSVWDGLLATSLETGTSLNSSVELFQRLAFTQKELGATNKDMVELNDIIAKLGVISGATNEQLKNGTLQLSQGLGEGIFRAQEFNSVLENMPAVLNAIARSMGVTVSELRKLVKDGKLLSKDVFAAILSQGEVVEKEYKAIPPRVGRAWSKMMTSLTARLSELNKELGVTEKIAAGFELIASSAAFDSIDSLSGRIERLRSLLDLPEGILSTNAIQAFEKEIIGLNTRISIMKGTLTPLLENINKLEEKDPFRVVPKRPVIDIDPFKLKKDKGGTDIDRDATLARERSEILKKEKEDLRTNAEETKRILEDLGIAVLRTSGKVSEAIRAEADTEIATFKERVSVGKSTTEDLAAFRILKNQEVSAKLKEIADKDMERMNKAAKDFGDAMVQAFESRGIDAILNGDLSGALKGLIRDFAAMALRLAVLKPLAESIFKSTGGGSIFGSIFKSLIGGKAGGGAVQPGVPVEVGERGRELFIPNTTGRIVNAADTRNVGRGQTSITQNITVATDVKNTVRAEMFQLFPILEQQILNSVNQQFSGVRA